MGTPRVRDGRAMTLLEMVVALVVVGLLIGFTLPRVGGAATFAEDQKAQTTASGALDAAVAMFVAAGDRDGYGCTTPDPAGPRRQMDTGPYPTDGSSPTSCPAFANPESLGEGNGDVEFVVGDQTSTSAAVASVAAMATGAGWRVAVAVLAPRSSGATATVSSCWIAWHEFPGEESGTSRERYFSRTNVDDADAGSCTGDVALTYDTDAYCDDPGAGHGPLGLSWRRPCPDFREG